MKKIIVAVLLLASFFALAQEKYQYVVVPETFNFFKNKNQYNVNALTKSFFETEGFTVLYDNEELPLDLAQNKCKMLFVDAVQNNKLFSTNILLQIKDCQNKVVIESKEGISREKDYQKAYTEAFREALSSLKGKLAITNSFETKSNVAAIAEPVEVVKPVVPQKVQIVDEKSTQLFVIPIENGFKVVDSTPSVHYILQETTSNEVYLATKGTLNGVLLKKADAWFFDYYQDGKLISEKVNVKF